MKAIIWGSCGSLPSPASSATIREKLKRAFMASRNQSLNTEAEIDDFLDHLPQSTTGTFRANTSCVQIDAGLDDVILCDAGTGIRDYALSLPSDQSPRTYHIFISHLHWDHIQGFPFFTPAYLPGNRIIFHTLHKATEATIRAQMDEPCFPVPFSTMQAEIEFDVQEEGATFQIGDLLVRTIKQEHPGTSWGFRFEQKDRSIIYSTDSEHGPECHEDSYPFIPFFQDADILIFDGQYTALEAKSSKRHWGHSDHHTGVELAARAQVKQLVLCHHEPSYSDEEIEQLRVMAEQDRINYAKLTQTQDVIFPLHILSAYDGLVLEA